MESDFLSTLYDFKKEVELSYHFDLSAIQDSFRFRALHRARAIAAFLIDEKGELDLAHLEHLLAEMQNARFAFYPEGFNEGVIAEHILRFLERLLDEPGMFK